MDFITFTIQSFLQRSFQHFMPLLFMSKELGLDLHWCNMPRTNESTNSLSNYGFLVHILIYLVYQSHRMFLPIMHYDGWWPKHKTVAWLLGTTLPMEIQRMIMSRCVLTMCYCSRNRQPIDDVCGAQAFTFYDSYNAESVYRLVPRKDRYIDPAIFPGMQYLYQHGQFTRCILTRDQLSLYPSKTLSRFKKDLAEFQKKQQEQKQHDMDTSAEQDLPSTSRANEH